MPERYCSLCIGTSAEAATEIATSCAALMTDAGAQDVTIGEAGLQNGDAWVVSCVGMFTPSQLAQLEATMTDEWKTAQQARIMGTHAH